MSIEHKKLFTNAHGLIFMRPAQDELVSQIVPDDRLPNPGSTFALNGQAGAWRPPEFRSMCVGANAAYSVRYWTYSVCPLLHDAKADTPGAQPIVMSASALVWVRQATVHSIRRLH
jgi:hypothetical protein